MQSTARDFWKMVHDRKCGVIVMLSDLVEGGQVRMVATLATGSGHALVIPCLHIQEVCYKYWPSTGSQRFGEFTVELLGEERLQGFVLRTVSVEDSKVSWNPHMMYEIERPSLPQVQYQNILIGVLIFLDSIEIYTYANF